MFQNPDPDPIRQWIQIKEGQNDIKQGKEENV
jgi:hypothetical protein